MNTESIIIRVDLELKNFIQKQAENKGLSISAYTRMILKEKQNINLKENKNENNKT